MSATRTLLRRRKDADMRAVDGESVACRRIKPATPFRRVLWERRDGDFLASYHATKGHRRMFQPE